MTISGNRELRSGPRAVATNGTADNTKASKKFETFGTRRPAAQHQHQRVPAAR